MNNGNRRRIKRRNEPNGPVVGMLTITATAVAFLAAALGTWMLIIGAMLLALMFVGSFADAKYGRRGV